MLGEFNIPSSLGISDHVLVIFVSSTTRLGGFNARLILYLTRFECSVKLITYECVRGVQRTDDRWVVSDASWHALD